MHSYFCFQFFLGLEGSKGKLCKYVDLNTRLPCLFCAMIVTQTKSKKKTKTKQIHFFMYVWQVYMMKNKQKAYFIKVV